MERAENVKKALFGDLIERGTLVDGDITVTGPDVVVISVSDEGKAKLKAALGSDEAVTALLQERAERYRTTFNETSSEIFSSGGNKPEITDIQYPATIRLGNAEIKSDIVLRPSNIPADSDNLQLLFENTASTMSAYYAVNPLTTAASAPPAAGRVSDAFAKAVLEQSGLKEIIGSDFKPEQVSIDTNGVTIDLTDAQIARLQLARNGTSLTEASVGTAFKNLYEPGMLMVNNTQLFDNHFESNGNKLTLTFNQDPALQDMIREGSLTPRFDFTSQVAPSPTAPTTAPRTQETQPPAAEEEKKDEPKPEKTFWEYITSNLGLGGGALTGGAIGYSMGGIVGAIIGAILGGGGGAYFIDRGEGVFGLNGEEGDNKPKMNAKLLEAAKGYAKVRFTDLRTGAVDQEKADKFVERYTAMIERTGMSDADQEKRAAEIVAKTADIQTKLKDGITNPDMLRAVEAARGVMRDTDTLIGLSNDATRDLPIPTAVATKDGLKKATGVAH